MRNQFLLLTVFTAIFCFSAAEIEAQVLSIRPLQVRPIQTPRVASRTMVQAPIIATPSGNWYPYVIARPGDREWIRQTPMELRPNRPMHFWGNSRRRMLR